MQALGSQALHPCLPERGSWLGSAQGLHASSYMRGGAAALSLLMGPALLLSPLQVGQPRESRDLPGVTACQWQCEDRATRPLCAPSPAGGWAGTAGGWPDAPQCLSRPPLPPALPHPAAAPAVGSRLRVCRAELGCSRGLGGESAEQQFLPQKPHCSQQILPGSGGIFFK